MKSRRRASTSITANIAEGFVRIGKKDKLHFYNISQGLLEETRNFLILSRDLGYISPDCCQEFMATAQEISKMLNAYCKSIINEIT